MQYKIARVEYSKGVTFDFALNELVNKVNELIKQGWRPQGGIETGVYKDYLFYVFQAMIKDD